MRLASMASLAALSTLLAGSAAAMPAPAPYHGDPLITLAAGGCGPTYHRNVYGACVPNGWGGGVVVAPRVYGGGWRGGYYHGRYYRGGAWHGGRWYNEGQHWRGGGGGHWHGGGGHWHGGGHHGGGGHHHR